MKRLARTWKPSPLPLEFHLCLDEGKWESALRLYQAHPFNASPLDTFELLKSIVHKTNTSVEDVKRRLDEKLRLNTSASRRDPEEIDWGLFWNSVNTGDSRTISMALCGARISGTQQQIGVAETCAILLQSYGDDWHKELVEQVPYANVTRNNLLTVAWQQPRWDVACEMLDSIKIVKGEMLNLWPLVKAKHWEVALQFFARCPKNAVAFDVVIPHILDSGCDLETLSHSLERAKVLGDVEVVSILLARAVDLNNWEYVERCMHHLHDVGELSTAAFNLFQQISSSIGTDVLCERLSAAGYPLHTVTVEDLEEVGSNVE